MNKGDPAARKALDTRNVAKQIEVEFAILLSVEQSLRLALQWMTRDRGNGHKLSTLRFVAGSFERHLTRMRVLADHGGYLHFIGDTNPHLAADIETLRNARQEIQANFERIILRLEYVSPDDAAAFDKLCAELECYLDQLKAHGQQEMELIQHAFIQEEGGEG
jgi:hypothetical protein